MSCVDFSQNTDDMILLKNIDVARNSVVAQVNNKHEH